jgi:hypothetical protein
MYVRLTSLLLAFPALSQSYEVAQRLSSQTKVELLSNHKSKEIFIPLAK